MSKTGLDLEILGKDGNAFAILGAARRVLRDADFDDTEIQEYTDDAQSGDYNHLLRVTMEWFEVC